MQITLENLSEAVASADQHAAYAEAMRSIGQNKLANKHQRHADAIMTEVYSLTKPADADMTPDELIEALRS